VMFNICSYTIVCQHDLRSRVKELHEAIEKIKAVKNNRYNDMLFRNRGSQ